MKFNNMKKYTEKELKTIFSLNAEEYPEFPLSKKFKNMLLKNNINLKTKEENIPWVKILTTEQYNSEINSFNSLINNKIESLNFEYYDNVFYLTENLLSCVQPSKINEKLYSNYCLSMKHNSNFNSFEPNINGFCDKPNYSLTNSRTGRMTITSGPNILGLEKSYRNILESRFGENGKLWYLDFISAEPRFLRIYDSLLFSYTGDPPPFNNNLITEIPQDIYSYMIKKTKLTSKITRDVVKKIVLWQCYGMKKETIIKFLEKNNIDHPYDVYDIIEDFYGLKKLKLKLLNELKNSNNIISNFYGRKIKIDTQESYKLPNYFAQSSSVDVCLLGFNKIIEKINSIKNLKDLIVPTFFIHDAMILDTNNDVEHLIPKLCEIGSKNIQKFEEYKFHIGYEEFSKTYQKHEV